MNKQLPHTPADMAAPFSNCWAIWHCFKQVERALIAIARITTVPLKLV